MKPLLCWAGALVLGLAACAPVPEPDDSPETATCGADGFQTLLGQERTAISALRFTGAVRVIGPGDMVTMDFQPQRINFETDRRGRITRIYCG